MKAISLHQPYASLIILGHKPTETRHWPTGYRGPLAIHATQKLDVPWDDPQFMEAILSCGMEMDDLYALPRGAVLGTCELVDCIRMTDANILLVERHDKAFGLYEPGRYMWKLSNIKPLKQPLPCKDHQGFFNVEMNP